MIYLDNSATTPIDPEVREAMLPYLQEEFGNPSSKYYTLADQARKAVEEARDQVAALLNAKPDEIIFTSGATESNNFIFKGLADSQTDRSKHIITTAIEHKSILATCQYLAGKGFRISYADLTLHGQVPMDALRRLLQEEPPLLVSIMWGNNELGTTNHIANLAALCQEHNVFFHSDATQVLGKCAINLSKTPVHFLSCSAHKLHGPKGIGACYIRKNELGQKPKITPLLHGGSQESGYRSGTLAVHNIVGFGKACQLARQRFNEHTAAIYRLQQQLLKALQTALPTMVVNTHPLDAIPGVLSLTFPGVDNERLAKALAAEGFAVSTGSACSAAEPSYVLKAVGLPLDHIRATIRVSLNHFHTAEILRIVPVLQQLCETCRR